MPAAVEIGDIWGGRYRLEALVAESTMAVVYRAVDRESGQAVAVKILDPEVVTDSGEERFTQEIRLESQLDHPRIVPVVDSGSEGGVLYYVMPFLEGESLAQRLARDGPMPLDDVRAVVRALGEALAHAHERNVVHRDVKPDNVFLTGEGPVILDFGIARDLGEMRSARWTKTGVLVGTPGYMSPEQASGSKEVDTRSDQYSLGCVVYEMLTGELPFTGRDERVVIARQISGEPPSLAVARPDVPGAVVDAVRVALSKSPAARHPSVAHFVDALHSDAASRAEGAGGRRAMIASMLGAAVVAAVVAAAWIARPGPRLDANRVVGFPLADVGTPGEGAITGEDVALWLGIALQRAEPVRWIDGWQLLPTEGRADVSIVAADEVLRLARSVGAGLYLTGRTQHAPDSTRVVLVLWDAEGDSLIAQTSAASPAGEFGSRSALGALIELLPGIVDPGRDVELGYLLEREPAAVAAWLEGERMYRGADLTAALDAYQRALAMDSLAAPAALKAAQAANWLERGDEAATYVQLALRRAGQLTAPQRSLAEGFAAYLAGDLPGADGAFRAAARQEPEWAEAWMGLAEAHYHLLGSDTAFEAAYARAARLDPDFVPPLIHLFEIAVADGDHEEVRRVEAGARRVSVDSTYVRELDLVGRCALEGPTAVDWTLEVERAFLSVRQASRALAVAGAHPECAADAGRAILAFDDVPFGDWLGAAKLLAGLLVAGGRADEAMSLVEQAHGMSTTSGLWYLAHASLGVPTGGRDEAFADWLLSYLPTALGEEYLLQASPSTVATLATWYGATGRSDELAALMPSLDRRAGSGDSVERVVRRAAGGWRALLLGDTATAIAAFAGLEAAGTANDLAWDLAIPMASERLQLARLYAARGEHALALDAATVFDHPQPVAFLAALPESLRIRLRAAEALQRRADATAFRERLDLLTATAPASGSESAGYSP